MIAGLDSHGGMYLSLYQANSNSKMMELFFTHFIRLLDAKDKYWKNHTILLLDNAPYHSSKEMMAFYRQHQLPIIFTGPHSYVSTQGTFLLYIHSCFYFRQPRLLSSSSLRSRERTSIQKTCRLASRT
jgi:hypothetical protein